MKPEFQKLRETAITRTKQQLKTALALPDRRVMQAIGAIGECEESLNVISERLQEWYGLYFPELRDVVPQQDRYAHLVSETGTKENFKDKISKAAEVSIGANFSKDDIKAIRKFSDFVGSQFRTIEKLGEYVSSLMKEHYPNLNEVAGSIVGAKLIQEAGGVKRLSRFPSSTVQVLGAEKALFRHLKTGAKPPKHGIILSHNLLQNTPRHLRGKAARVLAAKISIAVRQDYYGGEFIGEKLREEVEEKIKGLRRTKEKAK